MAIYKQEIYEQAKQLRKSGFSYTEIAKICQVSRGTLSRWLKNEDFSQRIADDNKTRTYRENAKRMLSINKARKNERQARRKEVLAFSKTEFSHYKHSPLFIAGLSLYKASGDQKHPNLLRFSAKDPDLHKIFIKFVTDFLGVDKKKIKFWLLLYVGHNEEDCMRLWSKKTGLSLAQFYKNQFLPQTKSKQMLHFGVGNTIIGSTVVKEKLSLWLKLFAKEILK